MIGFLPFQYEARRKSQARRGSCHIGRARDAGKRYADNQYPASTNSLGSSALSPDVQAIEGFIVVASLHDEFGEKRSAIRRQEAKKARQDIPCAVRLVFRLLPLDDAVCFAFIDVVWDTALCALVTENSSNWIHAGRRRCAMQR